MAPALGKRATLRSGPWKAVLNTKDPFDDDTDQLVGARNGYIPDPTEGSGFYARPGFELENNGTAIYTSGTRFKGQGTFTHYGLDTEPINFCVFGGKLFRADAALAIFTDVTPVGVAIDGATTTRVFFEDMGGVMAVNDGVHRPWVASNLSSTPITGTYIDIDGAGTAWTAFGPPRVYGGAGFFVLNTVNGIGARLDIAWSEPNDWTTGYQQTDFDNRWTLEQTSTAPLYGIAATNTALYYWRQRSIGSIAGTVGIDLASTATHDAISANVGTEAPQTIVQFGNTIFFCDVIGRPWMFTLGSAPKPIWEQLRQVIDDANTGTPGVTAIVATAAFDPILNLFCAAIWSPSPTTLASPTEWHSFDAYTGNYVGRGSIGMVFPARDVDCLGSFLDASGRATFVVLGSAAVGGVSGFAWGMNPLRSVAEPLGTEALDFLGTEDLDELATEGQNEIWKDNGEVPLITATTDRMGYSDDYTWLFDEATVITGTDSPVSITITTPNAADVVEGTPTPNGSADGMYRSFCGLNAFGRGALVTVSPTTADEQWSLQRVVLKGVPNLASSDDA